MTTRKLERSEWKTYFEGVAKRLPTMRVAVSVLGADLGAQHETEDSALIGITYDPNDGFLEVATPNITHRVANPEEIYVQETLGELACVEVIAPDGTKQIIELKPLPALPPT